MGQQIVEWTSPPADDLELATWFHVMRERAPVHDRPDRRECHIFGYAEARAALDRHSELSNAVAIAKVPPDSPFMLFRRGNLSWLDQPRHQRLRKLVQRVFTPFFINSLEPMVRDVVDEVFETAGARTELAFVEHFATPIVSRVIANMVGIPAAHAEQFSRWAAALMALVDPTPDENGMQRLVQETRQLHEYLQQYVAYRRADPADDLTSQLTQVEVDGAGLDDDEIAGLVALLMNTGVTSNQLLINAMVCLDRQPAAAAAVRADPSLMGGFIEESVRYRGQTPRVERFSMQELTIGEHLIPAGRHVSIWLGAANRDPARFPEPDTFDLSRSPNPHLGFGHGIHFCLGAALGRIQTAVALRRLLADSVEMAIDYDRSRLLDPRLVVGATELIVQVRWRR